MFEKHRRKLVVAAVAALAVTVVAGGVAATGALSPREESDAVLNDTARRLGVEPSELSAALKASLKARVDDAVQDGRLTQEQAAQLKRRIDANEAPLFGLGPGPRMHHHHRFGPGRDLGTAASYLGLTQNALRTELMSGKTLAQVARERNKSVDGLVDALVNEARADLDRAVRDGRLTDAQRDEIVADLRQRIGDKVNGRFRGPGPGRGFRRSFGFGPPPGSEPSAMGIAA